MRYGISNLSIVPVRTDPSETSEMCTQILFGEHYSIVDENKKWCKVVLAFDGYSGWIDQKMVHEISGKSYQQLCQHPLTVTTNPFNIVQPEKGYGNFLIVALLQGSQQYFSDRRGGLFHPGRKDCPCQEEPPKSDDRKCLEILQFALSLGRTVALWCGLFGLVPSAIQDGRMANTA